MGLPRIDSGCVVFRVERVVAIDVVKSALIEPMIAGVRVRFIPDLHYHRDDIGGAVVAVHGLTYPFIEWEEWKDKKEKKQKL